jgi:hypothetical protein
MAGLLLIGVLVLLIALYLAERLLKARAKARRLQDMNDRLGAVAARVDKQQAQKRERAQAREALTNVMPAINRPPLSLPGVPAQAKPSCERASSADRGTGGRNTGSRSTGGKSTGGHSTGGRPARRGGRTGDHPVRASERHGA